MDIPQWLSSFSALLLALLPWALWAAWWLWAVNWKKLWPALAEGAWAPVVLLMIVAALVWSRLQPGPFDRLGFAIPSFWWQLGGVSVLVAIALFCGWLQGYFGWSIPEISFEPPAHGHDDHGHDHAHHIGHEHGEAAAHDHGHDHH